jgi:hypothetical protein
MTELTATEGQDLTGRGPTVLQVSQEGLIYILVTMHKHPVTSRRKKRALINGADQQRSCNTSGAFGGMSVDVLAIHPVVDGLRDFYTTLAFQPLLE